MLRSRRRYRAIAEPDQSYGELSPVPGAVEVLRDLKRDGHYLIVYTARHMKTCGGNVGAAIARQGLTTLEWLRQNGIVVDEVCFGKPYADLYVDDCAMRFTSWSDFKLDIDNLVPRGIEERRIEAEIDRSTAPVLVVSAAGRGSRLGPEPHSPAGTAMPKALIDVCGRPMIWWAMLSLRDVVFSKIVFVALEEHDRAFRAGARLEEVAADLFNAGVLAQTAVETVILPAVRKGQLLSVLAAREHFIPGRGLLIASCDTLVASPLAADLRAMSGGPSRGLISVVEAAGDHWSFARADEDDRVIEVAEKRRISNLASTGIYYYSDCQEFLKAADVLSAEAPAVGNEYYVMPVYQQYLKDNLAVKVSRATQMWDMGERGALNTFLKSIRELFLSRALRA